MTALDVNMWDSSMRQRVEALQWAMAKDLLRVGATVIIEWGTWGRDERDGSRVFQVPDEAELLRYDRPRVGAGGEAPLRGTLGG